MTATPEPFEEWHRRECYYILDGTPQNLCDPDDPWCEDLPVLKGAASIEQSRRFAGRTCREVYESEHPEEKVPPATGPAPLTEDCPHWATHHGHRQRAVRSVCVACDDASRARERALREALEFYADARQYAAAGGDPPGAEAVIVRGDRGSRARAALSEGRP